jgi:hypothetical protein
LIPIRRRLCGPTGIEAMKIINSFPGQCAAGANALTGSCHEGFIINSLAGKRTASMTDASRFWT